MGIVLAASLSASALATPRKYVVVLKEAAPMSVTQDARALGATPTRTYHHAFNGYAATLSDTAQRAVKNDPDVLMAVPDVRFNATESDPRPAAPEAAAGVSRPSSPPSEERAKNGFYLATDFPQFVPTNLERVGVAAIKTPKVNGVDQPLRVGVAVIDTGIETGNAELNVAGGTNCSDSPRPGFGDVRGHGTLVAGVLGAEDNSFGVVGVAPGVRLYSVRAIDERGDAELSNVLCGIDWVIAHRGEIRVVNMSFTAGETGFGEDGDCGRSDDDPLHLAICKGRDEGITFVAAAGNRKADVSTVIPAAYSQVITVAGLADTDGKPGGLGPAECGGFGIGGDDTFAFFSNYGSGVDILAVATCVVSDYLESTIAEDNGTSFAAPAVAGAAAVLVARKPKSTPEEIQRKIEATGEPGPAFPGGPPPPILDVAGY